MMKRVFQSVIAVLACASAHAQINSGSNGSDGAFNPTTNIVVDMSDHPNGIYQYTSVNIPGGVNVTFIPNANNTPVLWLVQSGVVINGLVDVSGLNAFGNLGGAGGAGGYRGGNGGAQATSGQGPGGGRSDSGYLAANASYSTGSHPYGNGFLVPLLGGSGGSGFSNGSDGGGGGAILIATSTSIDLKGVIQANGGNGSFFGGGGSGGAIRFVATKITGSGSIRTTGGIGSTDFGNPTRAGDGRARFDSFENNFGGAIYDTAFAQGFQPIIIPTSGQGAQLTVTSVGGVPVSAPPSGALATPDAIVSAQQNNPISIVVHCSNIPLNTQITVSVKPVNGQPVSATGLNNTGTLSSSTATVSINIPRGGGLIYATATTSN